MAVHDVSRAIVESLAAQYISILTELMIQAKCQVPSAAPSASRQQTLQPGIHEALCDFFFSYGN